jgi:hypothetical protein
MPKRETIFDASLIMIPRTRSGWLQLRQRAGGHQVDSTARGVTPFQAAQWGVFLHSEAGNRLAQAQGLLGLLARELLAEIPRVMADFNS